MAVFNDKGCFETDNGEAFKVILTDQEKLVCLREILGKLKKILHVYEMSQQDPGYNYKVFCGGILVYISSSNMLFEGELVNLIVNLNAIINNDFDKKQIKRIIFESKNQIGFLIEKYVDLAEKEKEYQIWHDCQKVHSPEYKTDLDETIKKIIAKKEVI